MIKKIVNSNGDFTITLDDKRQVGPNGKSMVFLKDQDLKPLVNPNIIEKLKDAEIIEFVPQPVQTLAIMKQIKMDLFRSKRADVIQYDGSEFSVDDLRLYNDILPQDETELQSLLNNKSIETDSGYIVDSVEKVNGLRQALLLHVIKFNEKIIASKKAKNKTELNSITED